MKEGAFRPPLFVFWYNVSMDAATAIRQGINKPASNDVAVGKFVLKMTGGAGWSTPSEVHFTKDHPYQVVPPEEVDSLLNTGRFEIATKEEVLAYYGKS